jgi:hypothetical protein
MEEDGDLLAADAARLRAKTMAARVAASLLRKKR